MEIIIANRATIVDWYYKQVKKDSLPIVPIPDITGRGYVQTKNIKPSHTEWVKSFGCWSAEPVKVRITPLLENNHCHYNCSKMLTILNKKEKKYNQVLGYNFCSCPCGKMCSLELHSVLQNISTCEYVDLTTDFCGETEKWFVPIKTLPDTLQSVVEEVALFKDEMLEFYYSTNKLHQCKMNGKNITWRPQTDYYCGEAQLKNFTDGVKDFTVQNIL